MKTLQLNPHTALPGRTKELIGLGVAAQIPCRYCIVAHTEFAKLNGASEAEIGEAVAMAAHHPPLEHVPERHPDRRDEVPRRDRQDRRERQEGERVEGAGARAGERRRRRQRAQGGDADAGRLRARVHPRVPRARRAPAPGRQFRDVQLNPATALSGKQKELVGLAVASQVPCRFCIIAHTEFAKLNGATDAEINEAIGMASLTRDLSTMLNGMQVDEAQFRRDVDQLVKGAKAAAKKNPATAQR